MNNLPPKSPKWGTLTLFPYPILLFSPPVGGWGVEKKGSDFLIIKCPGQTIAEHPDIHRIGRNHIIVETHES